MKILSAPYSETVKSCGHDEQHPRRTSYWGGERSFAEIPTQLHGVPSRVARLHLRPHYDTVMNLVSRPQWCLLLRDLFFLRSIKHPTTT